MIVLDVIAAVLMLAGAAVTVIAAIGLHRMPDVYARMHVATKPATLGISRRTYHRQQQGEEA